MRSRRAATPGRGLTSIRRAPSRCKRALPRTSRTGPSRDSTSGRRAGTCSRRKTLARGRPSVGPVAMPRSAARPAATVVSFRRAHGGSTARGHARRRAQRPRRRFRLASRDRLLRRRRGRRARGRLGAIALSDRRHPEIPRPGPRTRRPRPRHRGAIPPPRRRIPVRLAREGPRAGRRRGRLLPALLRRRRLLPPHHRRAHVPDAHRIGQALESASPRGLPDAGAAARRRPPLSLAPLLDEPLGTGPRTSARPTASSSMP